MKSVSFPVAVAFVLASVVACSGGRPRATDHVAGAGAEASAEPKSGTGPPDRFGDTFLFGVCYYPEHWAENEWENDARRMRECGVNVVRMGEFAWYLMERQEGVYDFSLFDRAIAVMGRHGIRTILGTPTATPPKWLTLKYSDVLHVHANGRPADPQSRRHYCYNSKRYRELSARIVAEMARHYRDNPHVIGWQIDNEMSNENGDCFSASCRASFRRWLKGKYGSLDELNRRWGTQVWSQWYTSWQQVDLPFPTPAFHNPALMLDHKRFTTDSASSYLQRQVGIIRGHRPRDFVTHNGFIHKRTFELDYYRFCRPLDVYAHDNYPTFLEDPRYATGATLAAARGFCGRLMIMEQLAGPAGQTYLLRTPQPGQTSLWAFQAIAHGADGVLHFRWRAARRGAEEYWYGVLDHDNVPRARYDEFRKQGRDVAKVGKEVVGSKVVSDVAVIRDFEAEWAFDHQYLSKDLDVRAAYEDLFRAASEQKYNLDFISPREDFAKYKLVFAPHLVMTDPDLRHRTIEFVRGGGTFVLSAHAAVKDRDNAMTDQTIPAGLTGLLGVEVEAFQCYPQTSKDRNAVRVVADDSDPGPGDGSGAGDGLPVNVYCDVLKPRDARVKVVGRWDRDFFQGSPAWTERVWPGGEGKAVYYGTFFNLDSARRLLRRYATEQGLEPLFRDFPEAVEVTRRTKGQTHYYFILNHGATDVTVEPGPGYTDVIAGGPAPARLTVERYGYRVLKK